MSILQRLYDSEINCGGTVFVTDEEFAEFEDAVRNPRPPSPSIVAGAQLLRDLYGANKMVSGTIEHPRCTKCKEMIRGDIYNVGGGQFHVWCVPKVEFPSNPSVGCICPPGANLTCQRLDCPRKRPDVLPTIKP